MVVLSVVTLVCLTPFFPQAPSDVTLSAKKASLREIFDRFEKQTGESFEVDPRIAGDRLTLRLEKMPLFQAIEQVCRTHGKAQSIFQSHTRSIRIHATPFASYPRSVSFFSCSPHL